MTPEEIRDDCARREPTLCARGSRAHEAFLGLLAALDETDAQLAESLSRAGVTGGVYRELYSLREVVDAARQYISTPTEPGNWDEERAERHRILYDALKRHDEAAK